MMIASAGFIGKKEMIRCSQILTIYLGSRFSLSEIKISVLEIKK